MSGTSGIEVGRPDVQPVAVRPISRLLSKAWRNSSCAHAHLLSPGVASIVVVYRRGQVTAQVPDDANTVMFGIFLVGRGQIELRDAGLTRGA